VDFALGDWRDIIALALQTLYAVREAEVLQGFAAVFVRAVLLNNIHQIHRSRGHKVTMKKVKFKKHPAKMTSDELAEGVFHPKVLKAMRAHLDKSENPKKPPKSSK